jgi:hypothetical protein
VGKWLFFQDKIDGTCSLMDPFSGDIVQLPRLASFATLEEQIMRSFFKLVLPSSRRVSPDSLFAALTTCGDQSTISVGQASTAAAPASFRVPLVETLSDAAFFDGKLYAISHSNKLFVLDIDSSDQGRKPRIQSMKCVVADSINDSSRPFRDYTYWRYLVESGGRLLRIRRLARTVLGCDGVLRYRTASFDLFEADLTDSLLAHTPSPSLLLNMEPMRIMSTSYATMVVNSMIKILFTIVVCST